MRAAPVVVISGGAETVAVAIVEWAARQQRQVLLYALAARSLLQGMEGCEVVHAPSGGRSVVLDHLTQQVRCWTGRFPAPLLAFPTEDDSFGLLLDVRRRLGDVILFSRCRALASGGLEKAELFPFLAAQGLQRFIADTRLVTDDRSLQLAMETLGADAVLKPSAKPWARNLAGGAKVLGSTDGDRVLGELRVDHEGGRAWLAQRRLQPLRGGERSACIVRSPGGSRYVEVLERVKYPARGGSACWVETQPDSVLLQEAALGIADAVDAVGIVELSFLADEAGNPRLLELNARPWLQVELLQNAGFDVLGDAEAALSGSALENEVVPVASAGWISVERMLLKIARNDGEGSMRSIVHLVRALRSRPYVSVWSSSMAGVRLRWLRRSVRRLLGIG